jgi:ABC-type sugar transport system ATPase subunit
MTALLSLSGVTKHYGPVQALRGVDLDIHEGDALAICGDNGAGKSTLIRLISGAELPSGGRMALRGAAVAFRSPQDALQQGVATIYQDLALAPRSEIYQNVFMGAERTRRLLPFVTVLDKKRMIAEARDYLSNLNPDMTDMRQRVENLSGGQRQAVAISRALRWNADLIIMDEPTAALGVRETAQVRDLILRLREHKKTVIVISHDMSDVVAVASRVAILKQGRKVVDQPLDGLSADDLGHMVMTGLPLSEAPRPV